MRHGCFHSHQVSQVCRHPPIHGRGKQSKIQWGCCKWLFVYWFLLLYFWMCLLADWPEASVWAQFAYLLWCLVQEWEYRAILLLVSEPDLSSVFWIWICQFENVANVKYVYFYEMYRLDIGEGKEVNLEKCPRSKLQSQCIKYLGPVSTWTQTLL